MIEPPPPELAKLIAAERAAPLADHTLRAAVRAKVAATVAGTSLGAGAAAAALGAGKVLAIVAVVVGAGTVAVVKTRPVSAPTQTATVARFEAPAPPPAPTPDPPAPQVAPPPPPEPPRPVHARPAIPAQAELLQQAWSALSKGEPDRALELADEDARAHADGTLTEEREAIRVVALAKLGRASEASEASSRFLAKYPASIHREMISRVISGVSP